MQKSVSLVTLEVVLCGLVLGACQGQSAPSTPAPGRTALAIEKAAGTATKTATATATAVKPRPTSTATRTGTATSASESAEEKAEREKRSRRIGALKDKLANKREQYQAKQQQRLGYVNMQSVIDGKGIEGYNSQGTIGSVISGVASGNPNNPFGEVLAGGAGVYAVFMDEIDDAEQQAEVDAARADVGRQLDKLDGEISLLEQEISNLENELDELIEDGE